MDMDNLNIEAAIEAILFTMGDSVEISKITNALEITNKQFKDAFKSLKEKYEAEDRGIKLIELDGSIQLCTKPEMYEVLIKIAKQPKRHVMTDVLMETLSIIAYKQPVTRAEIEKIRGVSCSHAVNRLVEYNLAKEVGRLDAPGHPILFGTTDDFLRSFGISSMDDLPDISPDKIEDFRRQAEEEAGIEVTT